MTSKDKRQKEGIIKFINNNMNGIFQYVMGFGKTIVGLKIIDYYSHIFSSYNDILILVPSFAIKELWTKELAIYKSYYNYNTGFKNKVKIITVTSAINKFVEDSIYPNYSLVIIDEIHRFTSEKRLLLLKNYLNYKHILGLSGVRPNDDILNIIPIIDVITENEAIKNNWISNFKEYNIKLDMTLNDKLKYIEYSSIIKEVLDIFKDTYKRIYNSNTNTLLFKTDFDVIIACYRGTKYGNQYIKSQYVRETLSNKMGYNISLDLTNDYNNRINTYWNPDNIRQNVSRFYNAMNDRNTIHNFNEVKLKAVLDLYIVLKKFNKKFITFSESIDMADSITNAINSINDKDTAISYHSKLKSKPLLDFNTNEYITFKNGKVRSFSATKQLEYIIEGFNINKYTVLNTVNAVNEGFNLEILDTVITTSGTTNPIQYSQRSARGKRIDYYNPNKITIIINLYFDDFTYNGIFYKSRDKSKLQTRQNNNIISIFELFEFINYIENTV